MILLIATVAYKSASLLNAIIKLLKNIDSNLYHGQSY